MFQIRTSKPTAGNKNYITTGAGGWSTCIVGYPTDWECNVLANCVGYASGRFNEIINQVRGTSGCTYKTLNCNAENFIERAQGAGLRIGQTPKVGSIICWQYGSLASSDGAGHVAIVEKVIDNNTIYTSESGYGSSAFWNATRNNNNGRWGIGSGYYFRGFIYLPDDVQKKVDGNTPAPTPVKLKYKEGDKVVLNGNLYYTSTDTTPERSISGVITNITRTAPGAPHPYNFTDDLGWMSEHSVALYQEPKPATLKYKKNDRVIVNGNLYLSSDATTPNGVAQDVHTIITRTAPGMPHPYNFTDDLGWVSEHSVRLESTGGFKVGDKVVITGKYASSSNASTARNTTAIGWTRTIVDIFPEAKYPYQLGAKPGDTSNKNTTGFADQNSIRKA